VKIRPVDQSQIDQDLRLLEETVQKFSLHRIRDSLTSDLSPIMGYLRSISRSLFLSTTSFSVRRSDPIVNC
jgi:hypothetical protein